MGAPNGPPSGHPGAAGPSCELGRVPSVRESPSDDNYHPDLNFRGVRIREYRTSGGGGVIRLCMSIRLLNAQVYRNPKEPDVYRRFLY